MASHRFSRMLKEAGILFVAAFAGAQFIQPRIQSAPAAGPVHASAPVRDVLRAACYDCHSTETKLAWFDRIAPVSWLVAEDVQRGRAHLDFTRFDQLPAAQQSAVLFEAINQVRAGDMPPRSYRLAHPAARVTTDQVAAWEEYLTALANEHPPAAAQAPDGAPHRTAGAVRPAPNGIAFMPDYRDWQPIGSTERFDNHTLRVILGNETARRAIEEHHTNPWPNGAAFAKVAWEEEADASGTIQAGRFTQVEFMIKDAKRYEPTKGWGWARWKGDNLEPYGAGAGFTEECVGCHTPMRGNDYVFTTPADLSLPGDLRTMRWRLRASSVDPKSRSTSMLLANEGGAVLALVTWAQQADSRWFGARTPAAIQSVEAVTVGSSSYRRYTGSPLREVSVDGDFARTRSGVILKQRVSLMP